MNIIEVIKQGFEQTGYNGLVCPGICGCKKDDLSPGNCLTGTCEPGYKHEHSISKCWVISTKREPISDDDIQQIIDECA
jgi:hypothetical protein